MKRIYFLEKFPYMGVELLDYIQNYSAVFYNNDSSYELLKRQGLPVFTHNKKVLNKLGNDIAVERILSDKTFMDSLISDRKNSLLLFFYMNKRMNDLAWNLKLDLALPSFNIQDQLGNKLFVANINKTLSLPQNKSFNFKNNTDKVSIFKKCSTELRFPFIVQGSSGVSGDDTFLINSESEFINATNKLSDGFKASKYLDSVIPISVHLCITKEKVYYEGPFLQIIGFPELSSNPFQFAGNDTNQSLFSYEFKKEVKKRSIKIAKFLRNKGYLGIAGVDFLWVKNSDTFFLQEINSRLVGLTRLLTGIQKEQNVLPDLVRHVKLFTPKVEYLKTEGRETSLDFVNSSYSQICIANNSNKTMFIKHRLTPGIYKLSKNQLVRTKDSLFFKDLNRSEILFTYIAYSGLESSPGGLLARLLLKKSAIKGREYELTEETKRMVSVFRNQISN